MLHVDAQETLTEMLRRSNTIAPERCTFSIERNHLGITLLIAWVTVGRQVVSGRLSPTPVGVQHSCDVVFVREYGGEWLLAKDRNGDYGPIETDNTFALVADPLPPLDCYDVIAAGGLLP